MPSRLLALALALSVALAVAGGCKRAQAPASVPPKTPSIRLYVVSTLAGALEPCGCVKDMLGGVDKAASFIRGQSSDAPNSLVLGAGPMFFMDPELDPSSRAQDEWKAEAIAGALSDMGLAAWAPGANDWAAGDAELDKLVKTSGAKLLGANLSGVAGVQGTFVSDVGGYKVGIAGVSVPRRLGILPKGVEATAPEAALAKALAELTKQGAKIKVALVAVDRGQALRMAEKVRGFQVMIVGKPYDRGDGNDAPTPPVLVGGTLVVQGPNHLQGVGVVDLFVRGDEFTFRDGSNIVNAARRESLQSRIRDLEKGIAEWEKPGSGVAAKDLGARRRDLQSAKQELSRLSDVPPPAQGSFFRYKLTLVRDKLGKDSAVVARMNAYYRKVNEHNRVAFKDRVPPPVPDGTSGYVGVDACTTCHASERKFWDTTQHSHAYASLATQSKQFNLDCVGCHVTGYDQPGGSTVTHVAKLQNIQCEVCHGPGSRHVAKPADKSLINGKPDHSLCADRCHHPPHVDASWNANDAWKHIIGPGHGA